MTKKERIEELERRVAELEANQHTVHYMPYWSVIPPTYGKCSWCGGAFLAGHNCRAWWSPTWTSGGTNSNATTIGGPDIQVLYSGAN